MAATELDQPRGAVGRLGAAAGMNLVAVSKQTYLGQLLPLCGMRLLCGFVPDDSNVVGGWLGNQLER